jgi:hypothetical protein
MTGGVSMAKVTIHTVPNDPDIRVSDHREGHEFRAVVHDTTAMLTGQFPGPKGLPPGFPTGTTHPTFPPRGTLTVTIHPRGSTGVVEKSLGDYWDSAKAALGFGVNLLEGLKTKPSGGQSGGVNVTVTGSGNTIVINYKAPPPS